MARPPFKLEWDAHEYEHKERSQDWFWAVGIITVSIAVVSIIFGNIIFAILVLISSFTLCLFINREPDILHIIIDEKGVTRGNIRYPYSTLESFWIDEDHPHKKVILRSQKMLMPLIIVPLAHEIDTDRLHKILLRVLKEEYHDLPWLERLLEYLGF